MSFTLGQRLVRLRTQKGEKQIDVARLTGITRGRLSQLENDYERGEDINLIRSTLGRLAEHYDVLDAYLLVGTPQEYIAAWVGAIAPDAVPYTFGGRLALVLKELQLRWGEAEFSAERMAVLLGTTPELLNQYLSDALQVTDTAAQQLCAATGAPLRWLVPQQGSPPDPAAPFQHAVRLAMENGMQPKELETLIQVWLAAQQNRPSG